MRAFGFGPEIAARRQRSGPSPPAPSPTPPPAAPTGFALNGSSNAALKAALAAASAGTGWSTFVFKGDSTTAGCGAAVVTDGSFTSVPDQLAGAAAWRPSAMFAAELTSAGWPAWDSGFVGDQAIWAVGVPIATYDPRVSWTAEPWAQGDLQSLAGGGYLDSTSHSGSFLQFQSSPCTAFEVVFYNFGGTIAVALNGTPVPDLVAPGATVVGNQVTLPSTASGFTRITVPAGALGPHLLQVALIAGSPLLGSARGIRSSGIGVVNHAGCGATSGDQAASNVNGTQWSALERLLSDAPAFTIINLGLNDAAQSVSISAYEANLQAMVTAATRSGDVLLVSPHPANPNPGALFFSSTAAQLALRDAAAAVAESNGIAYLDLYSYFGSWDAIAARTADGQVHPNRGMYAEIGQLYRRCIQAMAG